MDAAFLASLKGPGALRGASGVGRPARGVIHAMATPAPAKPPNVLLMIADDLGYGDVGCFGGAIPTPHIDRLCREGMRFTDAHSSSAVCSPSRYTLLTGRYHWRSRLQRGVMQLWEEPLIRGGLTVASLARRRGFRTACFGKWHLGQSQPRCHLPKQAILCKPLPDLHEQGFARRQARQRLDRASGGLACGVFEAAWRRPNRGGLRHVLWSGRTELAALLLH